MERDYEAELKAITVQLAMVGKAIDSLVEASEQLIVDAKFLLMVMGEEETEEESWDYGI
jgi:hypothetical protein